MGKLASLCVLFALPYVLGAFEPRVVTPVPVVGYQSIQFVDEASKNEREILIWYPAPPDALSTPSKNPWDVFEVAQNAPLAQLKKPPAVVVISHGYKGNPHQLSWLIRALVHGGLVVIGIQHEDIQNGKPNTQYWQRARDITLLIDEFEKTPFAMKVDLKNIGIAGFSLGGTTAISSIGGVMSNLTTMIPGQEYAAKGDYLHLEEALPLLDKTQMSKHWKDPRIQGAFVMAPALAWLFNEESLEEVYVPTYLIAASGDTTLISRNNAGFFARHIRSASYQEIPGKAGHYIFISALNEAQAKAVDPKQESTYLFLDDTTVDRPWIQQQVGDEAVRFFLSIL